MATLEQLENDIWPEPIEPTRLVAECNRLRKKELDDFSNEDLRIMIGQGIGLTHLTPIVLGVLAHHPLTQGDFYPGDLLKALIREGNWVSIDNHRADIATICRAALPLLIEQQFENPELEAAIEKYLRHTNA